jgi:hypothetical protein
MEHRRFLIRRDADSSDGRGTGVPGSDRNRRPRLPDRYNRAVFETLIVRDRRIAEPHYAASFGLVFGVAEFEQGSLERETGGSRGSTTTPMVDFRYRFLRSP